MAPQAEDENPRLRGHIVVYGPQKPNIYITYIYIFHFGGNIRSIKFRPNCAYIICVPSGIYSP